MEQILDSVIRVAALLILLIGGYLAKRLDSFLKSKLDKDEAEKLDQLIDELVLAAEQLYKLDDEDGSVRLGYVQGMLMAEGYSLTETIRAKIESRVFNINQQGS